MPETLTNEALPMARSRHQPEQALLHHSDRGAQYANHAYQAVFKIAGVNFCRKHYLSLEELQQDMDQ